MSSLSLLAFIVPTLGTAELVIILLAALIIFGPASLPALGRGLGRALCEFRLATQKLAGGVQSLDEEPKGACPPPPSLIPNDSSAEQCRRND